jgi:MFS family permease
LYLHMFYVSTAFVRKRAASRKVRRQIGPIKWGAGIFLPCRNPFQQLDVLSFGDFNGRGAGTMSASPKHTLRQNDPSRKGPTPGLELQLNSSPTSECGTVVETDIPARLDALPWSRFHTYVVAALGVTWILDGLEVTLTGALAGILKENSTLGLTNTEIGLSSSAYLGGAVFGALLFGWLTDRFGRKTLFFITLATYLVATAATGLSWNFWSFALFRAATGAGIGGETAAVSSTIQELIPARMRGWTDLAINGSFWIGAAVGAAGSIVLLDPAIVAPAIGWRLAFLIGAVLGSVIFLMRFWIPESPRWLMTHGQARRAEAIVAAIEGLSAPQGQDAAPDVRKTVKLHARSHTPLAEFARTLLRTYPQRTLVGLCLMASQAFFYNAIFFTYALILTDFYAVPAGSVGWYLLPFAAGNFFGPLLLGRLFDTVGRKTMIGVTYAMSGLMLAGAGFLFERNIVSAEVLTISWMIIFFFASAAASSAYLTVSEIFPLEIRALSIAFFYAVGTGIGGTLAPWLLGALIDTGSRASVASGYYFGAALMIAAGLVGWRWGVAAERRSLEQVCRPLTFID